MMTSGPAGESEVLSLLRVISDPNGASDRLKLLSEKAAAVAAQEEAFNAAAAETTARIKEQQDRADRDASMAEANLNAANKLLEANQAREAGLTAEAARVKGLADGVEARSNDLQALWVSQRDALVAREAELATREKQAEGYLANAKQNSDIADALRDDYDRKLAQLRAIAG